MNKITILEGKNARTTPKGINRSNQRSKDYI